jgi:hypothetical protein
MSIKKQRQKQKQKQKKKKRNVSSNAWYASEAEGPSSGFKGSTLVPKSANIGLLLPPKQNEIDFFSDASDKVDRPQDPLNPVEEPAEEPAKVSVDANTRETASERIQDYKVDVAAPPTPPTYKDSDIDHNGADLGMTTVRVGIPYTMYFCRSMRGRITNRIVEHKKGKLLKRVIEFNFSATMLRPPCRQLYKNFLEWGQPTTDEGKRLLLRKWALNARVFPEENTILLLVGLGNIALWNWLTERGAEMKGLPADFVLRETPFETRLQQQISTNATYHREVLRRLSMAAVAVVLVAGVSYGVSQMYRRRDRRRKVERVAEYKTEYY